MKPAGLRLGVNIDHVATIRNARGGGHPDPVRAARLAAEAGADGITAHLREDRRHISDRDIERLSREIDLPLNLEMAATEEMLAIALKHKPHAACLVPEKREERTTEGGLDVRRGHDQLERPSSAGWSMPASASRFSSRPTGPSSMRRGSIGAPVVELHTGAYCEARGERIASASSTGWSPPRPMPAAIGLECHAGHGLTFDTVAPVAAIPTMAELNIGHFLVGEAIFGGLRERHPAHARADGRGAGAGGGQGEREPHDPRHRQRHHRHPPHRADARALRRPLHRPGLHRDRAAEVRPAGPTGRRAMPSASPPRRPAPRRWAPAFAPACSGATSGVVNLPSGKPTMRLTGGALARLAAITPPGMQAQIDLSLTDDNPQAQAIVIISAVPAPASSSVPAP